MEIQISYSNRRRGKKSIRKKFKDLESFKVFAFKQPISHYKVVLRKGPLSVTVYTDKQCATGEDLSIAISRVHESMVNWTVEQQNGKKQS
jgi:hypothetical protein